MSIIKKLILFDVKDWPAWLSDYIAAKLSSWISKEFKRKNAVFTKLIVSGVEIKKVSPGVIDLVSALNGRSFSARSRIYNSDPEVFEQVMLGGEYQPLVDLIKEKNISPTTMIDCGANVGYTSIYLSAFFPFQKLIMVEPNESTFKVLEHNVRSFTPKADLLFINQGIWYRNTKLKISPAFRDNKAWSFSLVEDDGNGEIPVIGLNELLDSNKIGVVDILKIDIEGAEKFIFEKEQDISLVLARTKFIAIEIHDEMECREQIERTLRNNSFEFFQAGELTIGYNNKLM